MSVALLHLYPKASMAPKLMLRRIVADGKTYLHYTHCLTVFLTNKDKKFSNTVNWRCEKQSLNKI